MYHCTDYNVNSPQHSLENIDMIKISNWTNLASTNSAGARKLVLFKKVNEVFNFSCIKSSLPLLMFCSV